MLVVRVEEVEEGYLGVDFYRRVVGKYLEFFEEFRVFYEKVVGFEFSLVLVRKCVKVSR